MEFILNLNKQYEENFTISIFIRDGAIDFTKRE
jgi:hypothetical protein